MTTSDETPIFGLPFPDPNVDPFVPSAWVRALAEATEAHFVPIFGWTTGAVAFTSAGEHVFDTPAYKEQGARAALCQCIGGGGGGGGAQTTSAGEAAAGGGGGQGGISWGLILLDDYLDGAQATVTVGDGGAGVSGAAGTAGGETNIFSTFWGTNLLRAFPGDGGWTSGATGAIGHGAGGDGGEGSASIPGPAWAQRGVDGSNGIISGGVLGSIGHGGGGVRPLTSATGAAGTNAPATASAAGFGGAGAFNYASQGTARVGGGGRPGRFRAFLLR